MSEGEGKKNRLLGSDRGVKHVGGAEGGKGCIKTITVNQPNKLVEGRILDGR